MDISTAGVITTIATVAGTVIVTYIAFKTAQLNKKVDRVEVQTNGILEAQTKAKDHAEGKAEAAVEIAVASKTAPP